MGNNKYCVIMAGGVGSRLWPVSTQSFPKQFLEVGDSGKSFLRTTYERFCTIVPPENIIVVSSVRYAAIVSEQIPSLPKGNILLEPYARNTAPCIAYATYAILQRDPSATVVVTPCDHIILDESEFRGDVLSALDFASGNDALVTLGVSPTRPDPNFGYIQVKGGKSALGKGDPVKVKTFVEKPDVDTAKIFMDSREFVWNAGIFVWKASVIKEEIDRRMPELAAWFQGWENAIGTPSEADFILKAYGGCERKSIDFGLMEKTDRAWVYPASFRWSDIGSWVSLSEYLTAENGGNTHNFKAAIFDGAENNVAVTTGKNKLVVVSGLEDFVVVDTERVLFICPNDENRLKRANVLAQRESEKYR